MTATDTGTLADVLTAVARSQPHVPALVLPRGRSGFAVTTYAELDRRSDALAIGLLDVGIGPGVRTALMVPPTADFFSLAFALLKAAAVPVLVDPGIGLWNVKACLGDIAPAAFVGVPRAQAARRLLGWCPTADRLVSVGPALPGARSLRSVERQGAARPLRAPTTQSDTPAAIVFTSGSTGVPKGVVYHHEQFLAQLELLRAVYGVAPSEVSVATFPPFALLGPVLGLTTVVPRMDPSRPARVDPRRVVDAVTVYGATMLFGSPALLDTVGRWGVRSGARLPSLRRVVSAGAPVSPAVQRRFLSLLGPEAEIHTPYGATEALPVSSIGSRELSALREPGVCVGHPVPGVDVAILRITDDPLPALSQAVRAGPGEVGEIVVRGRNVTTAYAERPAATAAAKLDWGGRVAHRMGDLGYLDNQGRLWFCGRKAHRVTTATGTLFTSPAEEVMNTHAAVRRSALVGVGSAGSQQPVLCVELERPASPTPALTRELLAVAARHPSTAAIRTVLYHHGFPVDIRHNAKIDRLALGRWAAAQLR